MPAEIHLLGVRHHGPGSARAVRRALDALQPDAVLVELPADAESALRWVGDADLRPPVALLGYVVDRPQRAAFLPFATFSPEWGAFSWANAHGVALRAIDLPLANSLASDGEDELDLRRGAPVDPLGELAAAAGDDDAERWWEDVIEHRHDDDPLDAFRAVAEAITAVRGTWEASSRGEARREAHMRQCLRKAVADGHQRIVVVCGAWHVPALALPWPAAKVDSATLRGTPKAKTAVSWVPWTHRRLAAATGYRAGVSSPGWYAHVFEHPGDDGITQWFVGAARLLRERGTSVSPDHLIAAHRGATTLAALRGRPRVGLAEVLDAASAVMADSAGMTLIGSQLLVGDDIGSVPEHAPQVPLVRDLAAQQRAARLAPAADVRTLELDVRTAAGQRRSVLLHRLAALGVPWGTLQDGRGSSGTFRETWRLQWEPELTIRLIELSAHGTTVHSAAASRLLERAEEATALADLVTVLDAALLGDVPDVVQAVVAQLAERAVADTDTAALIDTLGPLARAMRYGDVRGTDAAALRVTFDGIVVRVVASIRGACHALDDDAAAAMIERLSAMQAALALCDHPTRHGDWPAELAAITERHDVHGLVQGRACRLLHDGGAWPHDRVGARMSRALSGGTDASAGAAFVEGFLAGSGTVLLHDRELLDIIDTWVAGLRAEAFITTVPLLRRTFGSFEPAERRQLGVLVAGNQTGAATGFGDDIDADRAAAMMLTVRTMLGVPT
jgi:hypothetical protein